MRGKMDSTNGKAHGLVRGRGGRKNGDDEADETGRSQMMRILNGKGGWHGQCSVSERWNNTNGKGRTRSEKQEGKILTRSGDWLVCKKRRG